MKIWHYLALALLCFALYLPGLTSLPPFDRDEARFAQASKQMVETGDVIDIRLQDEPRYKKPIGIYWLQATSAAITGAKDQIWAYRIPSLLSATLAVLLTAGAAARFISPTAGLVAGGMLASTLILGVEARMAKTDATLLFSIVAAQVLLLRFWMEGQLSRRLSLLFWVMVGVGVLIKGPPILLICGGTFLVLSVIRRSGSWIKPLQPLTGLGLVLLLVAPWLIVITIKSGGQFWVESVGKDLLAKAVSKQESHGAPPGYYLIASLITFWPWAPFLLLAGVYAWKKRSEKLVQFLLAWVLPYWICYELFPTKLVHYTMPTYPALAMLAALALTDRSFVPAAWLRRSVAGLMALLVVLVALAVPMAPVGIFAALAPEPDWQAAFAQAQMSFLAIGAGLLLIAAAAVAYNMRSSRPQLALAVAVVGLVNFYAAVHGSLLPSLQGFWLSRDAAEMVAPYRAACPGPVVSVGYGEPSLVFLLGTETRLRSEEPQAAEAGLSCQLLLVTDQALKLHDPAQALVSRRGFNYSKGDALTLYLFRLEGVATP